MNAPPLTHHDIIELAAPFAHAGRHVDLAGSDRTARRVAFKPTEHASAGQPTLQETLELESLGTGTFKLTRTLTHPGGLRAQLQGFGPDPATLWEQMAAVAPHGQFSAGGHAGAEWQLARSYDFSGDAAPPVLTRGEVCVQGLALEMTVTRVKGVSAEIVLTPSTAAAPELPQDLLAVLGWNWARLVRQAQRAQGWKTRLRLRGNAAKRTQRAEAGLLQAAEHLARTLALPPARFHDDHLAARWGVVFRRSIPLLTVVSLFVTVAVLPRFNVDQNLGLWALMYHVPTVLIALSFCLQEMPQFEVPPLPRRSTAPDWFTPAGQGRAAKRVRSA